MTRRLTVLVCLFLVSLVRPSGAQSEDALSPAVDAHRPHRWSLQFQVVNDFQLAGFDGAGLAVTRNGDASNAWRLGVSWLGDFTKNDGSYETFQEDTLTYHAESPVDDVDHYGVGVDILRLHRFHPGRRVGVELGLGPQFAFDFNRRKSLLTSSGESHEERMTDAFYGIAGRFGAEVMVARSVSLHAHYRARIGYRHRTDVSERFDPGGSRGFTSDRFTHRTRGVTIGSQGVAMGLSLYL